MPADILIRSEKSVCRAIERGILFNYII